MKPSRTICLLALTLCLGACDPLGNGGYSAGLFASPWVGVAVSAAASLAASLLLWHLVERPALREQQRADDGGQRQGDDPRDR